MGRRIDRVQIALDSGMVEIPWASREALLARLPDTDAMYSVRRAFEAVGTSQPVRLTTEERAHVLLVLTDWQNEIGPSHLPDGLDALWDALAADLPDRPEDDVPTR